MFSFEIAKRRGFCRISSGAALRAAFEIAKREEFCRIFSGATVRAALEIAKRGTCRGKNC